jgi:hypothetical protein
MNTKFLKFAKLHPAATTSTATFISASIAAFGLYQSRLASERNADLAALSIIQQMRSRYLNVQRILTEYDIYNYHRNQKHYSEQQREKIRYYWEEIVFHEYVMCKVFQGGAMSKQWDDFYKELIKNALKNDVLSQEYAFFRKEKELINQKLLMIFLLS